VAHDPRLIAKADRVVKIEEGSLLDHKVRRPRRTARCLS
jgi:hypothetical protein